MKKCPNCKLKLELPAAVCPNCGFAEVSPEQHKKTNGFVWFIVAMGILFVFGAVGIFVGYLLTDALDETIGIITVLVSAVAVIVAVVLIIVKCIAYFKKGTVETPQPSAEPENYYSQFENNPTATVSVPESEPEPIEPTVAVTVPDTDDLPLYDRYRKTEENITLAELSVDSRKDAADPETIYRLTAAWAANKRVPNGGNVGKLDTLPPAAVYRQINELIAEAEQEYFLPEELWRRLDRFQDCLSGQKLPVLGNPEIRSIESYTSVYLACGGTAVDGFDAILAEKLAALLPVAGSEAEKLSAVATAFEEIFDAEAFPVTVDLLRRRCGTAER